MPTVQKTSQRERKGDKKNRRRAYSTKIKVLQANLNRSRPAHDIAFATAAKEGIDIIIASEPNRAVVNKPGWVVDKNIDVAIYFRNKNIEVEQVRVETSYVCITIYKYDIFCCYISPNITLEEYKLFVDTLMREAKNPRTIILGDLNAKSLEWGSPTTDHRGKYLSEWMAALDLVALNRGDTPTFERGDAKSYIDVTLSTQDMSKIVTNWKILDNETLSDHRHIYFEIGKTSKTRDKLDRHVQIVDKSKLKQEIEKNMNQFTMEEFTVESYINLVKEAHTRSCITRGKA